MGEPSDPCRIVICPLQIINLRNRTENTLSLDLFILGMVSYCLGMSLLTEWMGLSHEVRTHATHPYL